MVETEKKVKANFIKKFLVGLFSNNAAIEGSKQYKWWVAVLIGVLSVAVALVPTFVSLCNSNGSAVFSTYSYDYDRNIHEYCSAAVVSGDNLNYKFEQDNILTYTGGTADTELDDVKKIIQIESEHYVAGEVGHAKSIEFIAYYVNGTMSAYYESKVTNGISTRQYILNTVDRKTDSDPEGTSYYCPNYLILFKDGFAVITYKVNTTTVAAGSAGFDFKPYYQGQDFIGSIYVAGDDIATTFNRFKGVLDSCYQNTKVKSLWSTTGIYAAVFTGMILLLGLMLFLMTRGKNNMFNYLKYMDTQKMILWASLSPAILSLILGFLLPKYAMMFFIVLMGMRAMWMSMKQLRPQM